MAPEPQPMYYLAPPQDDRRGEWGTTPQGSGGAPQRPVPTRAPAATKPLEEKTERPEPPGPGADHRPMAAKSRPPQPPEVLAATSKAKPAQTKAPMGSAGRSPPGPGERAPRDQPSASSYGSYYSFSVSQSREGSPQEDHRREAPQGEPPRAQVELGKTSPRRPPEGPAAPHRQDDRRRPAEPESDPQVGSEAHPGPGHREKRPKAKLVQNISPERGSPGRRSADPRHPARGRCGRSERRGTRAREARSRSPRPSRGRRTHREDSRSPSDRRRRGRSRGYRRGREARSPADLRQRYKAYAQDLQKGRGRTGPGHAQGKGRPGKAGLQDEHQECGPYHARHGGRPQGGQHGPGHGRPPAGKSGKGKGPPYAPGRITRRGRGGGSQRSRSRDHQLPGAHGRDKDNDRRKERAGKRFVTKGAALQRDDHHDEAEGSPGEHKAARWFD